MSYAKECFDALYEKIAVLDEERDLILVKYMPEQRLFLRKEYPKSQSKIVQLLKDYPHPNIVEVFDMFETDSTLIVIEEFINGRTFKHLLEEQGPLDEDFFLQVSEAICNALSHLHGLFPPVIHRDIKLSNVMIDEKLNVKLIDFGISRLYSENQVEDTAILGTAGYAAPEQFGFSQTDPRSDIYSCGIMFNYVLTGLHPKEKLPESHLRTVIKKCINIDPSKRYQDAQQLKDDLSNAKDLASSSRKPAFSLPVPGFRTGRLWKMLTSIAGYTLIVMLVISYVQEQNKPVAKFIEGTLFLLFLLSLAALYTNFLNIHSHLPIMDHRKKIVRLWGHAAYTLLALVIFIFVSVIFQGFY